MIVDLILICIFVTVIIFAYRKGFVKAIVDAFGFFIAGILSFKLSEVIGVWIYDTFFKKSIISGIEEKLIESGTAESIESIKMFFPDIIQRLFGDSDISQKVSDIDLTSATAAENLAEAVAQPVFTVIIRCVLFLVLALILILLLRIVSKLITKTIEKTAIGTVNKIFGAVVGVIKGVIVVSLVAVLLTLLAALMNNESFTTTVESSHIIGLLNTVSGIFEIN